MTSLLIRNAEVVVTMNGAREEIAGASLLIEDGVIRSIGQDLPDHADEVIDASGCVITPGLVNTHHHLNQTLTRAVPASQDALLFGWLQALYPIWASMTPEDIFLSTQVGLAELALSGCTLSADHLYVFPEGVRLDDTALCQHVAEYLRETHKWQEAVAGIDSVVVQFARQRCRLGADAHGYRR